jgi:uncharacterized protein (TIGR00369 family)
MNPPTTRSVPFHGGLICTLSDSVTACAIHSTLAQGKGYTSVEIKVNYLKAVRLTSGVLRGSVSPKVM